MGYDENTENFLNGIAGGNIKALWMSGKSVLVLYLEDGRIIDVWGGCVSVTDTRKETRRVIQLENEPKTKPPIPEGAN